MRDQNLASDLIICSQEPIHIPGAIQPHGALLALSETELRVEQTSENIEAFLSLPPVDVLGKPLEELLSADAVDRLGRTSDRPESGREFPIPISVSTPSGDRQLEVLPHRTADGLILELEPAQTSSHSDSAREALANLRVLAQKMHQAASLQSLHASTARIVKQMTGYDRVMIYRFDPEWNGEVIAEAVDPQMEPYLGLHYPASDIPEQARRLYTRNWLRMIPDVNYTPALILPKMHPRFGRPLDLSNIALRSVSPIHIEYLQNMGVGASMSMSLIVRGKLWGLIACHHRTARGLPYATRAACEMMAQIVSLQIAALEERSQIQARIAAKEIQTTFFDLISREEGISQALSRYAPQLLDLVDAGGVAICLGEGCETVAKAPPPEFVKSLRQWIHARTDRGLFQTDRLAKLFPEAARHVALASGVLAVALSDAVDSYIIFFRPEEPATVTWAGNPEKAAVPDPDDVMRVHPRKSFTAWKQKVSGRSKPWTEVELEAGRELRNAINALILRRTDRLLQLNSELERKNSDINSFAHIASHDLKQPLRNMRNLAWMVLESAPNAIDPETRRRVSAIHDQAMRAEELIAALRDYSRLGRIVLKPELTSMDAIVDQALDVLRPTVEASGVEIRRKDRLPQAYCDPVATRQIWVNLLGNAAKYTRSENKWVEIGSETSPQDEIVYYVADNGVGIRSRQQQAIFQLFRRMHEPGEFGGGLGVGLAIVKAIVERHGGRVWVTSEPGAGSIFRFTLAPAVRGN